MRLSFFALVGATIISGCATTDVQPLTQTSFKIATTAAPACGPSGARNVANQAAAIEVINRGGDKFIFIGDLAGSRLTGVSYNPYVGLQTYNSNDQSLVVQMLNPGDNGYNNALSARQLLGDDWQEKVAKGIPNNCTE